MHLCNLLLCCNKMVAKSNAGAEGFIWPTSSSLALGDAKAGTQGRTAVGTRENTCFLACLL